MTGNCPGCLPKNDYKKDESLRFFAAAEELQTSEETQQNSEGHTEGYILVQARTAGNAVPITGARVAVSRINSDGEEIVGFGLTNDSGTSRTFEVEAPERGLSLSPGIPYPFASFDIRVSASGFYSIHIRDVQVFGGEVTLQNAEMIPLPENSGQLEETFTVIPQNL